MVIAKKIVQDKTRNFAAASGTRGDQSGAKKQLYYPRINKKVVIKSLSIPIPVYVNLDYKVTLKCEYQQQMNDLITPFMVRPGQVNAFILKRNGHMYESFIDQNFTHSNNVADMQEDTRLFTSDFTIRVLGYLIGEGPNDDRQLIRIDENAVTLTYPKETAASAWSGGDHIID